MGVIFSGLADDDGTLDVARCGPHYEFLTHLPRLRLAQSALSRQFCSVKAIFCSLRLSSGTCIFYLKVSGLTHVVDVKISSEIYETETRGGVL